MALYIQNVTTFPLYSGTPEDMETISPKEYNATLYSIDSGSLFNKEIMVYTNNETTHQRVYIILFDNQEQLDLYLSKPLNIIDYYNDPARVEYEQAYDIVSTVTIKNDEDYIEFENSPDAFFIGKHTLADLY